MCAERGHPPLPARAWSALAAVAGAPHVAPVAFALLVVGVSYSCVFFLGYWAINDSDALHVHRPFNLFITEALSQGRSPLWSPLPNLGQPVPNGSTYVLHPGLLLYALVPPSLANTIEILLGLFFTALGTFYWLREARLGLTATVIGCLTYVWAGPVYFLHSYHLALPAIALFPWCLHAMHLHDRAGEAKWLWLAALGSVVIATSSDPDAALYIFAALGLDRLLALPAANRRRFLTTWGTVLVLAGLTVATYAVSLQQWLALSSRASKSYAAALAPGGANLLSAVFADGWLTAWPYDALYFHLGPVWLWLLVSGLATGERRGAPYRAFAIAALIPIGYGVARLGQRWVPDLLGTFDLWRPMFVFCLASAAVIARGAHNVFAATDRQRQLNLYAGLVTLLGAATWLAMGGAPERSVPLFGVGLVELWLSRPWDGRLVRAATLLVVVIALYPATSRQTRNVNLVKRTLGPGDYRWRAPRFADPSEPEVRAILRHHASASEAERSAAYATLLQRPGIQAAHARVAVKSEDYFPLLSAGLRALPVHFVAHNRGFEETLERDGLIEPVRNLPHWMKLEGTDARALSWYGVRYLLDPDERMTQGPATAGLLRRNAPAPLPGALWENELYRGRAYFVGEAGLPERGAIEFRVDGTTEVVLDVQTPRPTRLVLADLWYPGWEARLDGEPVTDELFRGCLRAVRVPPGAHRVSWRFTGERQWLGLGGGAAAGGLLILFLIAVTIHGRRRADAG